MTKKRKPVGHWNNIENCKEDAVEYKTRSDFKKGNRGAYKACWRNGWLDEVCSHMEQIRKPDGYWEVKENCKEESLKYKTRSEFCEGNRGAYKACRRNGWMDEVCSHMKSRKKTLTY